MTEQLVPAALMALLLAAPLLMERYLRHLPVAPECPSCRAVAREVDLTFSILAKIPAFARTFMAECARCGWRGRMRWRWAPDAAGSQDPR
ncbi:MAG: hypothetical protein GEU90_06930 [Gemmatimonas sp.]|nr:hypothetical protein [Gemmatimonas sp.]